LEWTISHKFSLDCSCTTESIECWNFHSVGKRSVILARFRTLVIIDRFVLISSLERIWNASIVDNTVFFKVIPTILQRSSVTSWVISIAQYHVFWWKNKSTKSTVLDASTISQSTCWWESPAWTTV
jgi:hypothetical protein